MDAEAWQRARALFERLADAPPHTWEAQLQAWCPDDAALRADVLALLQADAQAAGDATAIAAQAPALLEAAAAAEDAAATARLAGTRLGAFVLQRELGHGGMGQVWLAERADGAFRQRVAIKLLRNHWDRDEDVARFRAERQILAGLQHPNIAHLVDGGVSAAGLPWLALEFVEGSDLRSHCDARRLDLVQRLCLFLTVCAAVSHAHQRLVVHRDLKPSNILVGADGAVKLLDFGIAKLLDAETAASATRVFTPEYAAPEQVRGDAVTTAVDVYALGLLLYELLTGRRPYRVEHSTPAAYEQAILQQEPTRPSLAVTRAGEDVAADELAARRHLDPRRLRRELRGDLDAIVLKALRKEPAQRYASVADLATDVQAWLERRPVAARRGTWRYRSGRFLRRHALAAGLAALAVLGLSGGLVVALAQRAEARHQRDLALAEVAKSRAVLDFMNGLFQAADPEEARGTSLSARELLERGAARIRDVLRDQPGARAELLTALGQAQRGLGLYEESLPLLQEAAALAHEVGDEATAFAAGLQHAEALHALARFKEEIELVGTLGAATEDAPGRRADLDLRRGLALQALNRLDEAADAYAAALQARRMAFGDADWRTQEVRLRQVSLLSLRQRHREALPLAQAVVDAVRRVTADADPHLADALNALAMVQTNLGQLESAEALRREELALVQRLYGASHPRTVSAENDLASVLYAQFRFEEAAALFDRVLAARRAKYGSDSPHVALVANNLAWCELDLGHGARARELAAEALQIRRAQYGDAHHATAASLRALGASELALGQLGEAGTHLRDAVASYEAALGPTSRSLLPVLDDLVRWELLAGAPAPRCATAQRAAQLYGLKADDASQAAAYQRVVLHACLVASDDAQADPAQLQAALDAVKRLSHPRSSTIGKAVLLADAAGRLSDRRSKAVRAR